jgi:predicted nicotinamide N-methyase
MTPAKKLDISGWKIPKDIKLADEQFNEPGSIDLLLGADLFYEMSRPGRYIQRITQYFKKQFLDGR